MYLLEICRVIAVIISLAALVIGIVGGVAIFKSNNRLTCICHIVMCLCTAALMFLSLVVLTLKVSMAL